MKRHLGQKIKPFHSNKIQTQHFKLVKTNHFKKKLKQNFIDNNTL